MAGQNGYVLPSVDRAIRVLEFLARSNRGFSVSEISRFLALPKSSTFLVLTTLAARGYLQKNSQTGDYYFGINLIKLSRNVLENLGLRDVARPFLNSLMQRTGLTVHLAVRANMEAVLIDRASPRYESVGADWIGRTLDLNCTGVGKALLAFLPEDELNQLIAKAKSFPRHNENTIVSIAGLKREFVRVRERGYAVNDEEDEIGVRCIGVPVFDARQWPIAAISVAAAVENIPQDRIHTLGTTLKRTAAEVTRRFQTVDVSQNLGIAFADLCQNAERGENLDKVLKELMPDASSKDGAKKDTGA